MFYNKKEDIDTRFILNETAKIILKRTEDIQEFLQILNDLYANKCPQSDMDRAMEILNHSVAETKMAAATVRDEDIKKAQQIVSAADVTTKSLYDEFMDIFRKAQSQ